MFLDVTSSKTFVSVRSDGKFRDVQMGKVVDEAEPKELIAEMASSLLKLKQAPKRWKHDWDPQIVDLYNRYCFRLFPSWSHLISLEFGSMLPSLQGWRAWVRVSVQEESPVGGGSQPSRMVSINFGWIECHRISHAVFHLYSTSSFGNTGSQVLQNSPKPSS